jgi:hypothetical protein
MPDYNVQELLPVEFAMRNKVMVPIDADLVAYFQSETEPSDWQGNINGVLRFYMETNLSREAEFQAALAAGPADGPAM